MILQTLHKHLDLVEGFTTEFKRQYIETQERNMLSTKSAPSRHQVIRPLIEAGWLEMTIPDKPTSSRQQYRLTDKGREALAESERKTE